MNINAKAGRVPARGAAAALLLAATLLSSCSLAPGARQEPASYDFGNLPAPAGAATAIKLTRPLLVFDVAAPAWLDTAEVHYRLAYVDATRPRAYANSRWVMPLSQLLSQRLRQQLAASSSAGVLMPADGLRAPHSLRVEIEEFTQVFDAPARSRAVLRARATLLGNRGLVAQRSFSLERPAATADAEGGVRALRDVADELIVQLIDWTAANAKP
jgi:cholesterol transport system auxiliary component